MFVMVLVKVMVMVMVVMVMLQEIERKTFHITALLAPLSFNVMLQYGEPLTQAWSLPYTPSPSI